MGYEDPTLLIDGMQPIDVVANRLTDFLDGAKESIHIAIYDFRLKDAPTAKKVVGALVDCTKRGIEVRVAYDHRNAPKFGSGDDPAPHGTHEFLHQHFDRTDVDVRPVGWSDIPSESIAGSKLMHSKYVVRDGHTPNAAVWMGSTNFTDDAWTRQDNNVLVLDSPELSAYYETDFNELWSTRTINGTGVNDFGTVTSEGLNVDVAFAPGEGRRVDADIASFIASAKDSVHIASMVITSNAIVEALAQAVEAGRATVMGIFDGPEMSSSEKQMKKSVASQQKVEEIEELRGVLVAKKSQPYSPTGVHNSMHNKLVVVDAAVWTGSDNFSLSAEHNAENAVLVRDARLAGIYREYVEKLVKKYGS